MSISTLFETCFVIIVTIEDVCHTCVHVCLLTVYVAEYISNNVLCPVNALLIWDWDNKNVDCVIVVVVAVIGTSGRYLDIS